MLDEKKMFYKEVQSLKGDGVWKYNFNYRFIGIHYAYISLLDIILNKIQYLQPPTK